MTIKVKYENGYLKVQDPVELKEGQVYEIELKSSTQDGVKTVPAEKLRALTGIVSLGGDAVKDCNALYD